ncbi:MAG: cysteine desulfurase-like protein [Actinobacteria bacterium]|nr:cysteine desulfurase-like protein [Actinomycetota bacterium]MTA65664.1 cysteine desulfurase-like protein [Actinomycetota bacterium]
MISTSAILNRLVRLPNVWQNLQNAQNNSLRHHFPGVRDGWSRFDGPAGTQMVDVAINAMSDWAAHGSNANTGGFFAAADACDALLESTRAVVGEFLGADPSGICLGANMTTMTMAFTRAVGRTLKPGDTVVGTQLDHEANVSPWRIACERSGAQHLLTPFDVKTGRLDMDAFGNLVTDRTKWVAITGASNLIGTMPDLNAAIAIAHKHGARVFVDAVALAPHKQINIRELGCDVLATSPYKWYGPHAGVMYIEPELLNSLPVAKVRAASETGPRKFETGTPNFESIAAVQAAARFLIEEDMQQLAKHESAVFAPLLEGLLETPGVNVWGPHDLASRAPTVSFTIDSMTPDQVAQELAAKKIAVWSGDSYAMEIVERLGLTNSGGVVRAGISRYIDDQDVKHLLTTVRGLRSR